MKRLLSIQTLAGKSIVIMKRFGFVSFGRDLHLSPWWDGVIPEIPPGWRPLRENEPPTRYYDMLWASGRKRGNWHWEEFLGTGSPYRIIKKV